AIRVRGVREAIAALAQAGLLTADEGRALADGHAFLTAGESRLRLERNQAVDAIDTDPDALLALARRLGYGGDDAGARAALRREHARPRAPPTPAPAPRSAPCTNVDSRRRPHSLPRRRPSG